MAIIFSKILTKTDVEKRLSLPTKSLKSLPSFEVGRRCNVEFQAMDGNGRLWRFGCIIRKKGHPKPVLSKGWIAFVAHNKLQIGDQVKFYQEIANPGASQYKVEVKKAVKLFGVVVCYGPNVSGLKGFPKFYKFM
ncbi:hypothetical protein HS088_TW23G00588 [Tripterygium wilfordii]|uniref:TF-B3 domain-containing protein n=1 Tax=Tripterygium wilfordii TaxID=458696 RepID=A0A7J7BVK5_TRIWF|nr:hypothetical protein HS088_TW23G00588 [Tripterygium wilfordii]